MNHRQGIRGLAILAATWIWALPAHADRPLAGRSLRIEATGTGARSLVALKSARTESLRAADPLPDPRSHPSSLSMRWSGSDPERSGQTDRIPLDPAKWSGLGQPAGSRGWRYHDPAATRGGIRSILIRQGTRSGTLRWSARGEQWIWPVHGPLQQVALDLEIGSERLCAAFDADTATIRINDPSGHLSAREMPAPGQCGEEEQPPPPATTTVLSFAQNRLYLIGPASADQAGELRTTAGDRGQFDRLPLGPAPLVYEAVGLTAAYASDRGESALWVYLDGSTTNGIYAQARILFDFENDGAIDREEVFTAAPAHANRGLDLYDSQRFARLSASGPYRDLQNGRIRIELHNPLNPPREGPEIRTGASPREHAASHIQVPFIFSTYDKPIQEPAPGTTDYPDQILCPPQGDARCAAARPPLQMSSEERAAALREGLAAFRFRGNHGSCAGCHVPDGFDLAAIGYRDSDILRRAREHVSEARAASILRLIQIQREDHGLTELLHPAHYRPLQPGFTALPGDTPRERDLAFLRHLAEEQDLVLLNDTIDSRDKALLAERQLLELDVHNLRIGVRLDRWSEDQFHGPSHRGQDPDDPTGDLGHNGSVAEWLPNLAVEPRAAESETFFALFDAYAANPTDLSFWDFYDAIRETSVSHEPLNSPEDWRAFAWMQTKYEAIQIMGHMLRRKTLSFPDTTIDQPDALDEAGLAASIARNPFWRVGDLIRQHPLNCNHPDGCTTFPDFVATETRLREQNLQSRYLQRAWFWAGWMIDDALLRSDDNFATISGDYFYPLHHGVWNGHYAFITARMSALKANVSDAIRPWHHARAGHGKWASIRPFLVFKHSEFQRPMVAPSDPRYFWNQRLMSNLGRMWLYLVHEDLERTGRAFDREGTAKAMNFVRRNWLESVAPGASRTETDRLYDEIVEMLGAATELREQHQTEDLYDYLPVEDVVLD